MTLQPLNPKDRDLVPFRDFLDDVEENSNVLTLMGAQKRFHLPVRPDEVHAAIVCFERKSRERLIPDEVHPSIERSRASFPDP